MNINEVLKEENIGKCYKSSLKDNETFEVVEYGDDLNLHSEKYGYIDDIYCVYGIINAEFEEAEPPIILTRAEYLLYQTHKKVCDENCSLCESCQLYKCNCDDECDKIVNYFYSKFGIEIVGCNKYDIRCEEDV